MQAICYNDPKTAQLLEEHGSQSYKYFKAIRFAVRFSCLGSVEYLLSKNTYSLNKEYETSY